MRISFGYLAYDSEDEAKSDLERRVGKNPVTVYYDPHNPKDAVLIREPSGSLSLIIIGVVLIVTPIVIGLVLLRR